MPITTFPIQTTPQLPPAPVGTVIGSTYTFASTDAQAYTVFNSTATITVTIPPHSQVPFPVGTQLTSEQSGTGSVVFASGSTAVVFNPLGTRGTLGQYAIVAFFQKAQDVWTCSGAFI
jgi:hypothetical protein